jgi:Protein of unknown function (DUF5661)
MTEPGTTVMRDEGIEQREGGVPRRGFSELQATAVAEEIGLDLDRAVFDVDAFRRGMDVELEHGLRDPETDVTGDDPLVTGKIAWAHLKEFPDYYDRLATMEQEAEANSGAR